MKNYATEQDVSSGVDGVIEESIQRTSVRLWMLFILCLIFVGTAGGIRFWTSRESAHFETRRTEQLNEIRRTMDGLQKRMDKAADLSKIRNIAPMESQFALIATAMNGSIAVRNIQYDNSIASLKDLFFIDTGLDMEKVEHGGLWTIDGISLTGSDSISSGLNTIAKQVLQMNAFVSTSTGREAGREANKLIRIVFWRRGGE